MALWNTALDPGKQDTAAKRNACALDFGVSKKRSMPKRCSLLEILAQVSCKSFLKFQVGIISLGALFRESRVNTKSPLSNGSTAAEVDLKHCRKTSRLNPCLRVPRNRILENKPKG